MTRRSTGLDYSSIGSQVTYAGHPLYLFDQKPLQVTGVGWDEPGIPPDHGLWYLITPAGLPLPWSQMLATTAVGSKTVLGAMMVDGALRTFPVYSLSSDTAGSSTCTGSCAVAWPPLLTGGTPGLIDGLRASSFGTLKRSDATVQLTYLGKPLYLYSRESIGTNTNGPGSHVLGNGNGLKSPAAAPSPSSPPNPQGPTRSPYGDRVGCNGRHEAGHAPTADVPRRVIGRPLSPT